MGVRLSSKATARAARVGAAVQLTGRPADQQAPLGRAITEAAEVLNVVPSWSSVEQELARAVERRVERAVGIQPDDAHVGGAGR